MTYAPAISLVYGEALHQCVACGGGQIDYWKKKDFQYTDNTQHKEFHIYRCTACGSGFLNQPPHKQWLHEIYQYSGQALTCPISLEEILVKEAVFPNTTIDAARTADGAHRLNRSANHNALDIGSGFGFFTYALRKQGYTTVSINPGKYENEVFKKLNHDAPVPLMFEQYHTTEQFGVVVMSQVLEHMLEPDQTVKKVSALLATGGVLACAVPNYGSFLVKLLGTKDNACLWIPEHVNYFTEKGLTALLERNGLQVIKIEQTTRVPFNALSRRLNLRGKPAAILDAWVKVLQKPFAGLMNYLGLGIYINLYAIKK